MKWKLTMKNSQRKFSNEIKNLQWKFSNEMKICEFLKQHTNFANSNSTQLFEQSSLFKIYFWFFAIFDATFSLRETNGVDFCGFKSK